MNTVQIDQKSYEMPPREGISIAYFLAVADIERSARYYEKVFGARILSLARIIPWPPARDGPPCGLIDVAKHS
jgi:hypothetical protein